MGTQGDGFMKKTQKGLSILAFETTKQSRILKKRMRAAALQKEVKADLRDLGNLVYNAVINDQTGILEEEEVKILVENIQENKTEVERLRDSIARLNRTRKHFEEEDFGYGFEPAPKEDTPAPAAGPATPEEAEVQAEAAAPVKEDVAEPLVEPETPKEDEKAESTRRAPKKTSARTRTKKDEEKSGTDTETSEPAEEAETDDAKKTEEESGEK